MTCIRPRRADKASGSRIQVVGLHQHDADEQRRVDLLLSAFVYYRLRDSVRDFAISGVAAKNLAQLEGILSGLVALITATGISRSAAGRVNFGC